MRKKGQYPALRALTLTQPFRRLSVHQIRMLRCTQTLSAVELSLRTLGGVDGSDNCNHTGELP